MLKHGPIEKRKPGHLSKNWRRPGISNRYDASENEIAGGDQSVAVEVHSEVREAVAVGVSFQHRARGAEFTGGKPEN